VQDGVGPEHEGCKIEKNWGGDRKRMNIFIGQSIQLHEKNGPVNSRALVVDGRYREKKKNVGEKRARGKNTARARESLEKKKGGGEQTGLDLGSLERQILRGQNPTVTTPRGKRKRDLTKGRSPVMGIIATSTVSADDVIQERREGTGSSV